ncbi:MAG: DUF1501 domain-containing protein [Verrucomicrobia bacterium]|nr:DUF1501 domain-containing protein [Verrucomicrobiota bacterium]
MEHPATTPDSLAWKALIDRRAFLDDMYRATAGLGMLSLLGQDLQAEGLPSWQPGIGRTHHSPRAKRVLQVFCPGAASHVDLWEHKPALDRYHGSALPGEADFLSFQGRNGPLMRSPWPFVRQGQSGKAITSMLPHLGVHADEIAFFHGMHSRTNTHGPGCVFMNTGHPTEGFPSAGAWIRMEAYELAARMQLSAPEVTDLKQEPTPILDLYGANDANPLKAGFARNCILARRLLERGVRYVNLYCASRASGVDGLLNWDAHKTLKSDYERHCPILDQPAAALLTDLKQRGLLEDTLVLWTTEFGRMPTHQEGTQGRDHNPDAFTCWMAGAGIRGGVTHGASDEFGRRAATNPTTVWDFYATALHLLGFDHEKLTYYHNGLDRRLTDVHGQVIKEVLA